MSDYRREQVIGRIGYKTDPAGSVKPHIARIQGRPYRGWVARSTAGTGFSLDMPQFGSTATAREAFIALQGIIAP